MKTLVLALFAFALALPARAQMESPAPSPQPPAVETLVCIRHGEKPAQEIGQLDIQGLNRSLALPKVLLAKYGRPQYIFAPNPAETVGKTDQFCYIRPLATIEPTAIACGLPVNTEFGFKDAEALEAEVRKPLYQNSVVFIAWEHVVLQNFVRSLVKHLGGDESKVPTWPSADFDSIYLVKITTQGRNESVTFTVDHEGLDNLPATYPGPSVPEVVAQPATK